MEKMKKMRKMKPSGVEWIGDIPQEWEVSLLKYSIKWKSDKGKPDATVLSLYRDYGIVPKDSRDDNYNVTSLDTSGYKVVDIGDFVINKMKAWQGSMAISAYYGIVSPAYHVCEIINDNVYKRYFHYLLRSDLYITEYTRLSKGLRIGQWDLDFNDFKNLPFLIPPFSEQQRIAEFLDRKCAEIDSIIAKTKATIEEYKALKQAVITQAVTKGIRPDRPMKDSGVEWIGDIPQEWEVVKLKRVAKIQTGSTPSKSNDEEFYSQESGYLWIKAEDLGYNSAIKKTAEFLSEKGIIEGRLFPPNTVYVCCIASIGKVGYTDVFASCNQQINAIQFIGMFWKYGYYLTISQEREYISNASGNVVKILNTDKQVNLMCTLPPLPEQQRIADYLDHKCAEIDRLIAAKEQLLTELESYKKSVIYEYVTGKKEI